MGTNERSTITMSDQEIEDYLRASRTMTLATLGPDGTPHLVAMWFAVIDGEIWFETKAKSQKAVNLGRDPRVTCLVEDGRTYDQLRGVSIRGVAELHTDPEVVHRLACGVMARNNPDVPPEMLEQAAQAMAAKRTAVVVKATHTVSWDHRKLGH